MCGVGRRGLHVPMCYRFNSVVLQKILCQHGDDQVKPATMHFFDDDATRDATIMQIPKFEMQDCGRPQRASAAHDTAHHNRQHEALSIHDKHNHYLVGITAYENLSFSSIFFQLPLIDDTGSRPGTKNCCKNSAKQAPLNDSSGRPGSI